MDNFWREKGKIIIESIAFHQTRDYWKYIDNVEQRRKSYDASRAPDNHHLEWFVELFSSLITCRTPNEVALQKFRKLSRQWCVHGAPHALSNYWFSCVYLSAGWYVALYILYISCHRYGAASFKLSQHKSYTVLINGIPRAVITFSYAKYALKHYFERWNGGNGVGTTTLHTGTHALAHAHICIFIFIPTIDPLRRVQHGIKLEIGVKCADFVIENQFTQSAYNCWHKGHFLYNSDAWSESRKWNFRRTFEACFSHQLYYGKTRSQSMP